MKSFEKLWIADSNMAVGQTNTTFGYTVPYQLPPYCASQDNSISERNY